MKRNVRIYVHEANLGIGFQEWDQRFQRVHHRVPVNSAREMVQRILALLLPGQYIEYLYIDGHGGTHGMDIGPHAGLPQVIHVVGRGETLWALAKRYYGDPRCWRWIYERNLSRIGRDPDLIQEGMRLVVPRMSPIADVVELRRLRARFAAGASVFLGGCEVGKNRGLLREISKLWGVHIRAGKEDQRGFLPGVEGEVVHCFIQKCRVEPATWWGVREGE